MSPATLERIRSNLAQLIDAAAAEIEEIEAEQQAQAAQAAEIDLPALLARRPFVPDGTLLDCLDLAAWLVPRLRAGIRPLLTTAELRDRWHCDQSTVSRRMQALRTHQLIDASLHPGRSAHWAVRRVGPTA